MIRLKIDKPDDSVQWKFVTGSTTELTQKTPGSKYKMTYIDPHIYKQISPIFNCVALDTV